MHPVSWNACCREDETSLEPVAPRRGNLRSSARLAHPTDPAASIAVAALGVTMLLLAGSGRRPNRLYQWLGLHQAWTRSGQSGGRDQNRRGGQPTSKRPIHRAVRSANLRRNATRGARDACSSRLGPTSPTERRAGSRHRQSHPSRRPRSADFAAVGGFFNVVARERSLMRKRRNFSATSFAGASGFDNRR